MLHVTVRIHISGSARLANFTNCLHFSDYVHEEVSGLQFKVVIPSYDRPEVLCRKTLALLRKHGVLHPSILVLITPGRMPANQETEWNRYRTSLLGN
jgi:hypothetical protein